MPLVIKAGQGLVRILIDPILPYTRYKHKFVLRWFQCIVFIIRYRGNHFSDRSRFYYIWIYHWHGKVFSSITGSFTIYETLTVLWSLNSVLYIFT